MEMRDERDDGLKASWARPQLVELPLDMNDIESGHAAGSDGGSGANTSLAS